MKVTVFSLITCLLLFSSCSKKIVDPDDEAESGGIALKIDKENVPPNVATVEAFLTREGYDEMYGILDILSETSAEISFEEVAAGQWHLKVDAKNEMGVVVYTGETDIEVLEGLLTQVNLTLVPTGNGFGSVYIFVQWDTQSEWIDFMNNPVLSPFENDYDRYGIAQPVVLKDGDKFLMWYTADAGGAVKSVFYAESNDGLSWQRLQSTPVLSPDSGSWDSWAVHPGAVIKEGGTFRMYYTGWSDLSDNWHIGLAISQDGKNWEKYPEPVLYGTEGWEFQIASSSVIKTGSQYYMYYYGISNSRNVAIGVAFSNDGIEWSKCGSNPVLVPEFDWETGGVYHASVINDVNSFKMVYMNKSADAFGMASSVNGIEWNKSGFHPFFTAENSADNWAFDIAYPCLLKLGTEYRIYYSGMGTGSYGYKIGLMRKFIE